MNLVISTVIFFSENMADSDLPIQKKILHSGRGDIPEYTDGTKVGSDSITDILFHNICNSS